MQDLITFIEPEQWANITDLAVPGVMPYYMVSTYGRIYSKTSNKILLDHDDGRGYRIIGLMTENGRPTVRIHRVVLITFKPVLNYNELYVNHKDTNKSNNYLYNLEWGTPLYNSQHAVKNNLILKGEDVSNAILTNDQVHLICKGLEQGLPYNEIAESIGPTDYKNIKGTLRAIRAGQAWKFISDQYTFENFKGITACKFTDDEVYKICEGLESNLNYKDILVSLGYDINSIDEKTLTNYNHAISSIRVKKTYTNISKDFEFPTQRSSQVFSDKQIHRICKYFEQGLSFDEVLYKLNIGLHNNTYDEILNHKSILSAIKNRARFKKISKDYNF
ncbi:MAG: NUMOD4 motif-containing HNH endonuclease [Bacilli bacterium]|nr:NUMOD4 motif-containing HNH endonuclease [Bacilli bacterium]